MTKQLYGYVAFWCGKRVELYAPSLLQAKQDAIEFWRVPRSRQSQVVVVLAEVDGQTVVHLPAEV